MSWAGESAQSASARSAKTQLASIQSAPAQPSTPQVATTRTPVPDRRHAVLRPAALRAGDTVAIVSPSAPAAAWWPHRLARASAYLKSLGLRVRVMPNATGDSGWVSGSPQERVADLHEAFADPAVRAVLATIGGNHCNQLLPYLDFDLVRANPKIFQGYSDVTVLHWAFLKASGLGTFYGPSLMLELAEFPRTLRYTDDGLRAAWFAAQPLCFTAPSEWTDEFLDYANHEDESRPRQMRPGDGWRALRPGVAEGPLLGGCLQTICSQLKGSAYWLDLEGAILMLEASDDAGSPAHVDAHLTDLEQLGVFDQVAGLVFGRPIRYDDEEIEALWRVVLERTAVAGIPVLGNVDVGHADPMLTVPLGVQARIDVGAGVFETLESAAIADGARDDGR